MRLDSQTRRCSLLGLGMSLILGLAAQPLCTKRKARPSPSRVRVAG